MAAGEHNMVTFIHNHLDEDTVSYIVRPMQLADVPQATEIDRECFPTQWPPPPYRSDLLFNRLARYLVACEDQTHAAPVEEREQRGSPPDRHPAGAGHLFNKAEESPPRHLVVGVTGFWLMAGEAHITTIGVRQAFQRLGIGELLLISTIDLALSRQAEVMTLEVRLSNRAARELYQKYGFTKRGIRRGYYTDNREDAVIMTTDTLTSVLFQSQFQLLKRAYVERWRTNTLIRD
jgi:ribosomal-protein-alanine N-acetyltransferase